MADPSWANHLPRNLPPDPNQAPHRARVRGATPVRQPFGTAVEWKVIRQCRQQGGLPTVTRQIGSLRARPIRSDAAQRAPRWVSLTEAPRDSGAPNKISRPTEQGPCPHQRARPPVT